MTTVALATTAVHVLKDIENKGGSTRSIVPGVPEPTAGYMVSLRGYEEVFSDWSDETVAAYIDRHAHRLSKPGQFIGAWVDTSVNGYELTETLYLDVSVNVAERSTALKMAADNDQLAIWDVARSEEIRLDSGQSVAA